jgi:geranylgeranyl diphosphate synthase type II
MSGVLAERSNILDTIVSWKPRIDSELERQLLLAAAAPPMLRDALAYSLLGPGKRLRPLLTLLATEAAGGSAERALAAGSSIEMMHTYSLVHDDLPAMDDDDLRRGRPTCHKKYGEALAILVGDALQALAFQVMVSNYPPVTAALACGELASAAGPAGMVGGQVVDLSWDGRIRRTTDAGACEGDLRALHEKKTGSLFRACLRIGQIVAEAESGIPNTVTRDCLDEYGHCFGLAFQITDDLLDIDGTEEATGKRVGKDAERGKLTYPVLLGVDESKRRVTGLLERAVAAVHPLGARASPLADLLALVVERDR